MNLTEPITLNTLTDAALLDLQAAIRAELARHAALLDLQAAIRAELARRAALYGTPTERA
jgi:hypothetical protein